MKCRYLQKVMVELSGILLLRGKYTGKLLGESFNIGPKPDSLTLKIHAVQQIILNDIDGLLQTIENKPAGVKAISPNPKTMEEPWSKIPSPRLKMPHDPPRL